MNRRRFLSPRNLAHAAGQLLAAVDEIRGTPDAELAEPESLVLRYSRRAMATLFEIVLPFGISNAWLAAEAGLDLVDQLEQQLTVYRADSEISAINLRAADTEVPVEARLFELLSLAARLHVETEGANDITAGALVKEWGFFRGPRRIPSDEEISSALSRVGMKHLALNRESLSARFARPGVEINLGSIGKGYALDRVAELLRTDWNLPSALLHGGCSSVYAMGTEPGSERGWTVGLQHPWDPERRLALIRLRDRGMGTSAATFQHLEHEGRRLGHILDPRSGWPAEGMACSCVFAPTAAEADALATAFFVSGIDRARAYCEVHPEIGAILLPEHADKPTVFGLTADEYTLAV